MNNKSVFVIGAGASFEADLPLGSTLKEVIANKLNFSASRDGSHRGDRKLLNALNSHYLGDLNEAYKACKQIHDGIMLSSSIDDFINIHSDNVNITICGKAAVAKSILDAERASKLYFDNSNSYNSINIDKLSDTWYLPFFNLITNDISKSALDTIFNNIELIIFNYDRCVEHFLIAAIQKKYGISKIEAVALVDKLVIYRPYGSIGKLTDQLSFGEEYLPEISKIIASLKTYCEEINDLDELALMRKSVANSDNLVFLGNAYHANNMKLLFDDSESSRTVNPKRIFATRVGISFTDLDEVRIWFNRITNYKVFRVNAENYFFSQSCNELFDDFKLSLKR